MHSLKSRLVTATTLLLLAASSGIAANIPAEVKKIVTFIYVTDKDGNRTAIGTGFLAGIKNPNDPKILHGYFVTARHVLVGSPGRFHPKIWLRFNTHDGGSDLEELRLEVPGRKTVYTHPTESGVDIAVIPVFPNVEKYDFKLLTENYLTTRESVADLNIGEGSDVFFTGLFTNYVGRKRNYPIVRFGRVALITDERLPVPIPGTDEVQMLELYLIDTFSFGGNSGAPVFFYLGADRQPGSLLPGMVLKFAGGWVFT